MVISTRISDSDISTLVELSEKNLGTNYLDEHYFLSLNNDNDRCFWKVVINGNVVGFLVAYRTKANDVVQKTNDISLFEYLDRCMYCLDTMVVANEFKRQGIGKLLIENALLTLGDDCGYIMYTWQQGTHINMKSIAEYFGFVQVKKYVGFWEEDCLSKAFLCPAKVSERCVCSMVFYYRPAKRYHE